MLTNVISFEQLGPELHVKQKTRHKDYPAAIYHVICVLFLRDAGDKKQPYSHSQDSKVTG